MKYAKVVIAVSAGMLVAVPAVAMAQPKTGAAASQHIAVTEGVFDLRVGEVTDLTDRRVLLSLPRNDNQTERLSRDNYIWIAINGKQVRLDPGARFNLKGNYTVGKTFDDMSECYLDLLRLTVPKGGAPLAQFRFHCR